MERGEGEKKHFRFNRAVSIVTNALQDNTTSTTIYNRLRITHLDFLHPSPLSDPQHLAAAYIHDLMLILELSSDLAMNDSISALCGMISFKRPTVCGTLDGVLN